MNSDKLIAEYDKPFEKEDFSRWIFQRTNVLTLVCLILEAAIVLASIVLAAVGIAHHYGSSARLITELALVLLCLALILYWRYGYPKAAGKKYYDQYQANTEKLGEQATSFLEDRLVLHIGDLTVKSVLYSERRGYHRKKGLLSLDAPDHICYIFREDGFSAESLTELDTLLTQAVAANKLRAKNTEKKELSSNDND